MPRNVHGSALFDPIYRTIKIHSFDAAFELSDMYRHRSGRPETQNAAVTANNKLIKDSHMKRFYLNSASAAVALALLAAPLAMAQNMPNHDQGMQGPAAHPMGGNGSHPMAPMPHVIVPQHTDHAPPMGHGGMAYHGDNHGYASGHSWHHGDHFYASRHVVKNWHDYRLHQPPAGYEWVQDGSQFVLIAVASGIIADVIVNALNQ